MDKIMIQDIGRNFLCEEGDVWELHRIDSKQGTLTFTRRVGDNTATLETLINGRALNAETGTSIKEKLRPLRMRQSYEVDNYFYDNFGGKWQCIEYQGDRDLYKMVCTRSTQIMFVYATGVPALQLGINGQRIISRAVDRTVPRGAKDGSTAKLVYDAASAEFPGLVAAAAEIEAFGKATKTAQTKGMAEAPAGWNEGDYSGKHEENTTAPLDAVQKAGMKIMTDAFGKIDPEKFISAAGGPKYDGDKSMVQLLPPQSLLAVGNVLKFGAQKYEAHSWHRVPNAGERYTGAALRHIIAVIDGESTDPESGLPHLAHAICSLMFVLELDIRKEQGRDTDGSRHDG